MGDTVGTIAAILASSVAIGAFLDRYASDSTKLRVWEIISGLQREQLIARAIQLVVEAYETIFGNIISSRKFLLRSLSTFVMLFSIILITVFLTDKLLFQRYVSSYTTGSIGEAAVTTTLVLFGALAFWVANAQTLYFLRLARADPRPLSAALIFYADTLLTASIATFGVGLILWAHTLFYLQGPPLSVSFDIRMRSAQEALKQDIDEYLSTYPHAWADFIQTEILKAQHSLPKVSDLQTRVVPSEASRKVATGELDFLTRSPPPGLRPIRNRPDVVQFIDPRGEIFGYSSLDGFLQTGWRNSNVPRTVKDMCTELRGTSRSASLLYVRHADLTVREGDFAQCVNGQPIRLTALVSINSHNLSQRDLLFYQTAQAFDGVLSATSLGFKEEAATRHPLAPLSEEDFPSWRRFHLISESNTSISPELDNVMMRALLVETNTFLRVHTKSVPAAPIIILILGTSIFTIALLISAFVAMAVAAFARGVGALQGPFLVDKHPFVFLFLVAGMVLASGSVLMVGKQ